MSSKHGTTAAGQPGALSAALANLGWRATFVLKPNFNRSLWWTRQNPDVNRFQRGRQFDSLRGEGLETSGLPACCRLPVVSVGWRVRLLRLI